MTSLSPTCPAQGQLRTRGEPPGPSLVSPEAFQRVKFQVKHDRACRWTYLPGAPSPS
jgi:hypothetical protein